MVTAGTGMGRRAKRAPTPTPVCIPFPGRNRVGAAIRAVTTPGPCATTGDFGLAGSGTGPVLARGASAAGLEGFGGGGVGRDDDDDAGRATVLGVVVAETRMAGLGMIWFAAAFILEPTATVAAARAWGHR